jgi:hypothetical protein
VIEQLGLEPSASLRDLERAILTQDPALGGWCRTGVGLAWGLVG